MANSSSFSGRRPRRRKNGGDNWFTNNQNQSSTSTGSASYGKEEDGSAIGNAVIGTLTAPAKVLGWLTGNRGGRAMIGVMAAYCAGLSIEAWYVTMPNLAQGKAAQAENRKFMPKPFIDDGADLGLLNPFRAIEVMWNEGMKVLTSLIPFITKPTVANAPSVVRCVWLDWRFYCAIGVSMALQLWQAKMLRSLSIEARKQQAQDLSQHKKMKLDPNSLDIANAKVAEYNGSRMGKRRANGVMIFLSYAVEMGTGFGSILGAQGVGIITAGIYSIIQAFGFEFMHNQLADDE